MDAEQLAATWRDGALVVVGDADAQTTRPAAFVYVDDTGLSWVEPSYADPMGAASPAAHRRAGDAVVVGDWIELRGGPEPVTAVQFVPEIHAGDDGGALAWFDQHLADSGTDWAAERERVRQLLD
jgi:hypothetical protein